MKIHEFIPNVHASKVVQESFDGHSIESQVDYPTKLKHNKQTPILACEKDNSIDSKIKSLATILINSNLKLY